MVANNMTVIVPHLTTALSGPLHAIENRLQQHESRIEDWFRRQWQQYTPPLYASVDIRNAGYKIAPVDTNLFPAGFNNLNPAFNPLCIQALQQAITELGHPCDRILVIPENHTRNKPYLEHLAVLQRTFTQAGYDNRIGTLGEAATHTLANGTELQLHKLQRTDNILHIDDYEPELIILNNDLSGGLPELLRDISQPIVPPPHHGWTERSKTRHFAHYQHITQSFVRDLELGDPWLFQPLCHDCGEIDFMKRAGEQCLQRRSEQLFREIRSKYQEHDIQATPYAVLKADNGTYGMGIMTIRDPAEVVGLNRKQRTRMATVKEGQKVNRIIIQEGIPTIETVDDKTAEPVVYTISRNVVGGFYRTHQQRGSDDNLNSPGMEFEPIAFADCCAPPGPAAPPETHTRRFYSYGVIGRLAILASAREADIT